MNRFRARSPQGQANLAYGLLLLGDLQQRGYIESGPFTVEVDRVQAELALLAAADGVTEPERGVALREVMDLMAPWVDEADFEIVAKLLHRAEVDWPG